MLSLSNTIALVYHAQVVLTANGAGKMQCCLAEMLITSPSALKRLVKRDSWVVLNPIACMRGLPSSILWILGDKEDVSTRRFVAKNTDSSKLLLSHLSKDEYWMVRLAVASNPNTPMSALKRLRSDVDFYVRTSAIATIKGRQ